MLDPSAKMPCSNRRMVDLGTCLIPGICPARERQVNVRSAPTGRAIEESVDPVHEIFNSVFRNVPDKLNGK